MRCRNADYAIILLACLSYLLILVPPVDAQVQGDDGDELYPFFQNNKVGYLDHNGKIVIAPRFDMVPLNEFNLGEIRFSEGLALICLKGKWGYINKTGKIIIKPQFIAAWPFSEGLAEVRVDDGRSGYINKTGKMVISPLSMLGRNPFSGGLAGVYLGQDEKGKWGFINKSGTMVIEPQFDAAGPFSEGLAMVRISKQYGIIDKMGKFVIGPQEEYSLGPSFSGGLAIIWDTENKVGFIDKSGKTVFNPKYRIISEFSEGLAAVDVNVEGETPPPTPSVDPNKQSGGRRADGYIDGSGKLVIEPQFEMAAKFSEGLAAVGIGVRPSMKIGYIDKTGAIVIPPLFDIAFSFHGGLALVATGGEDNLRWGYIDRTGSYVWQSEDK